MRALFDINVLVALLDADHVHHRSARAWLEREIHHGWASCAITQNGVVRVMSPSGRIYTILVKSPTSIYWPWPWPRPAAVAS